MTIRFKRSHRDTLRANNAADAYYAAMAGVEPQNQASIAPKRAYTHREGRKEADVIADVSALLASHDRVLYALRMNSGAVEYTNASGDRIPVWFARWIKAPERCAMSDFYGATVDCRILAVECKHPDWTSPKDERERKQAAFLAIVRSAGGIGIFATDAAQVAEALSS